jgi:NAD(P)-dependent dehydrogenase (short-subunit alcohol dehydrogenase family)
MHQFEKNWGRKQIGDQRGKTVIVTGANSGVGFYTALELGRAGATVMVACRDSAKGQDLSSVRRFADHFLETRATLDLLINNAGVMAIPERQLTVDGFERQFGTNHLGHFALTGRLLPGLHRSSAPRVVTLSGGALWEISERLTGVRFERDAPAGMSA